MHTTTGTPKPLHISLAYSANGRDIKIRNGVILHPGTVAMIDGTWVTLTGTAMVKIVSAWDNLCQAPDNTMSLIDLD